MAEQRAPSIPAVPKSAAGTDRAPFDAALKANIDILLGRVGGSIEPLASGATLADVVAKVNEIVGRLR